MAPIAIGITPGSVDRAHLCPQKSSTWGILPRGYTRSVTWAGLRNNTRMFHGGEAIFDCLWQVQFLQGEF
jgi:hypothetical protein